MKNISREALEKETTIEFFRGSGPGGQHRNKREMGVRLRHVPSGIVVEAVEERSQARNREVAFEHLAEELEKLSTPETPRIPTKPSRSQKANRLKEKHETSEKKKLRKPPILPEA